VRQLESLGLLAGGLAHDFNNLLMTVRGGVEKGLSELRPTDESAPALLAAAEATRRAANLTRQLLAFSKSGAPLTETANVGELIRESARFTLAGTSTRVTVQVPDDLWPADIDATQISQVLGNVLLNAKQATEHEGGAIVVEARNVEAEGDEEGQSPARGSIEICIADSGEGIETDVLPRVFDPYVTTREEGTGLGLATALAIVRNHMGTIHIDSQPGAGTTVAIRLPASSGEPVDAATIEQTVPSGPGRILFMDDDAGVRKVTGIMLEDMGFDVLFACDGDEALELYRASLSNEHPSFDAVVMDLTVRGGKGGAEAMVELLELDPKVRAVVSSGYADAPVLADHREHGFKAAVAKPFSVVDLGRVLRRVIDAAD